MNPETKLQDVIHFYLGCECLLQRGGQTKVIILRINNIRFVLDNNPKLILRKLSDMTEEDKEILDWD